MSWHTMREENEAWDRAQAESIAKAEHDAAVIEMLQAEHDNEMRAEAERERKRGGGSNASRVRRAVH